MTELQQRCARGEFHGRPINVPPANWKQPVCKPMERSRITWLRKTYSHKTPLAKRLLSFGGEGVCIPVIEEDEKAILERGQLFSIRGLIMKRGRPNGCHANSSGLWLARHRLLVLCTGYSLSDDGCWRQHSWCVMPRQRACNVIETTTRRILYYGFAMTPEEADDFYDHNL